MGQSEQNDRSSQDLEVTTRRHLKVTSQLMMPVDDAATHEFFLCWVGIQSEELALIAPPIRPPLRCAAPGPLLADVLSAPSNRTVTRPTHV